MGAYTVRVPSSATLSVDTHSLLNMGTPQFSSSAEHSVSPQQQCISIAEEGPARPKCHGVSFRTMA
eukprot:8198516-Heterocapsa_arctica.AAC.1